MKSYYPNFKIISFVIFFFALFGLAKSSWAATYYVDFQGGNDSKAGTSTDTPWKHSPGDSNATGNPASTPLVAGDKVIFKKGSVYSGQINPGTTPWSGTELFINSDSPDASVTADGVVAVGSGRDLLAIVTALAGGYDVWAYIYNISDTGAWVESCGLWKVASADNTAKTITLSGFDGKTHATAEMPIEVSKPITFTKYDSWGTGNATLDCSSVPACIGNVAGQFIGASMGYIVVDGLNFQNVSQAGISFFSDYSRYFTGIYVLNNTINYPGSYVDASGVGIVVGSSMYRSVAKNNTITGSVFWGISLYGPSALTERNSIDGARRGVAFNGDYVIGRYNTVTNPDFTPVPGGGHHGCGYYTDTGGYGWVYGNYLEHAVEGYAYYRPGYDQTAHDFTFHSNIAIGSYSVNGRGQTAFPDQEPNGRYYNNLVYDYEVAFGGRSDAPYTGITVWENNVVIKTRMSQCSTCGTLVADHNYYVQVTSFATNCYGVEPWCDSDYSWSHWQDLGYDTTGSTNSSADPSTILNTSTWQPVANSPLINAGTNLSSIFTLDKSKDLRGQGGGWDIGAYEYAPGGNTTPPSAPTGLTVN